jgi:hypothetical protein
VWYWWWSKNGGWIILGVVHLCLVTFPVGETLASAVEIECWISADETLRCCHVCLSALHSVLSGDPTWRHKPRACDVVCSGEWWVWLHPDRLGACCVGREI